MKKILAKLEILGIQSEKKKKKKDSSTVFSGEFCEIYKNTFCKIKH